MLAWIMTNPRKSVLFLIIVLAGISNMPLYVVQGALLTGHTLEDWPSYFWLVEWMFWGLRSLIEIGTIYYMLVTETENKRLARVLYIFEGLAILLILATLGSATIALDDKSIKMVEALGKTWSHPVKFAIVGYLPIIIGGAAIAYRIQPDTIATTQAVDYEQDFILVQAERDELEKQLEQIRQDYVAEKKVVQARVDEQRKLAMQVVQSIAAFKSIMPSYQVALLGLFINGNRPTNKEFADLMGITIPTVTRGFGIADELQPHVADIIKKGNGS